MLMTKMAQFSRRFAGVVNGIACYFVAGKRLCFARECSNRSGDDFLLLFPLYHRLAHVALLAFTSSVLAHHGARLSSTKNTSAQSCSSNPRPRPCVAVRPKTLPAARRARYPRRHAAHAAHHPLRALSAPSGVLRLRALTRCADTEIDWETYMVQVKLFLKGEQDYSRISGPTGPLVYVP
jgi:hypothetical protein